MRQCGRSARCGFSYPAPKCGDASARMVIGWMGREAFETRDLGLDHRLDAACISFDFGSSSTRRSAVNDE